MEHLSAAEAKYGKMKHATFKKPPIPYKVYKIPNFGVDADILDTQKHLKDAEKKLGKWNLKMLQSETDINIDSDPICGSGGCN